MIEWLYRKIFVAIVQAGHGYDVTVSAYKQKKRLYKETKRFEGESAYDDMNAYIQKYTQESPLHYIALLNPDLNQGGIEGCSLHESDEIGDLSNAKTLCRNQKWILYTSLRELDALKKRYSRIGLDFIFSPFSVLEHFFADKIGGTLSLYALAQKDALSIAFFEEGKLLFARHYPMHREEHFLEPEEESDIGFSVGDEEEEEPDRGIDLDDIESLDDLEIIDELDDLSDLEDLDQLEEIAEFSEEIPVYEDKHMHHSKGAEAKDEMDRFNDDFYRFELIQKTLSRFYKGEHCHNHFVETIHIADASGSSSELKRYLEEELFLSVLIRHIDVNDQVVSLAILEEEGL